MKTLAITILVAAACLVMTSNRRALAQSTCNTRCETQFNTCHAGAEAALTECLDRAKDAREKGLCAVAFAKLDDACRTTEATCLSNCDGTD
jgi:hypothetical protein